MATATINGKPSIFKPLEFPTTTTPDYETRIDAFLGIATEMAEENFDAETEARCHTNCELCQDEMIKWRNVNPTASETDAADAHREVWEKCPSCVAEYSEWNEQVERETELDALCDAHDPVAWELASLGDAALHAIAGHDAEWQAGG